VAGVRPVFVVDANPPNKPVLVLVPPRLNVVVVGLTAAIPSAKVGAAVLTAPNNPPVVPGLTVCKLLKDNALEAVVAAVDDPKFKVPVGAVEVCPNPPNRVVGFDVEILPKVNPVAGVVAVVFAAPNEIVEGADAEKALPVPPGVPNENPDVEEVPKPVVLFWPKANVAAAIFFEDGFVHSHIFFQRF